MIRRHRSAWIFALVGGTALAACSASDPAPNDSGDGDGDGDGDDSTGDGDGDEAGSGGAVVQGSGGMPNPGSGGMANMGGVPGPIPLANCELDTDCNDGSPCTSDTCVEGFCDWEDNGTCECKRDSDCEDENACTAHSCVNYECVSANVEGSCTDDGNPCTEDVCDAGTCGHLDAGICGENTIIIRSMRWGNAGQWISLSPTSALVWNVATTLTEAELFEVEEIADTDTFKLRALSNDSYVTFAENDDFYATAEEADGSIFSTISCGVEYGIITETDGDGWNYWKTFEGGVTRADGNLCPVGDVNAWERFEIIEVSVPGMGGAGGM